MKSLTDEREYHSSPGAVKDFIEGTIWKDMCVELDGAIEQLRDGLETAKDFESVMRLQECIDTVRRIKEMPRGILDDMEVRSLRKGAVDEEKDY